MNESQLPDTSRLWHIQLTLEGAAAELRLVQRALERLHELRPFLNTLRYSASRAEISYWDEAETIVDAASLALRMWNEYREPAKLPHWEVVGLQVLEQEVHLGRESGGCELHLVPGLLE